MGDTSLKFGGWGLCRTCWRQSQVKANGEKTKKKSGKKRGWKKKKKIGRDGPRGDRPFDPFQLSLRAALWTIGTSGKALYACKRTAFGSYWNLASTEVCVINKKTVLLIVLLYCYSSTMPA